MSPALPDAVRPLTIALAGLVSLAVAMGIGRFAFTPLLPMMLHEGSVSMPGASLLASANYLGYLVGALVCTFQPWVSQRLGRVSQVNGPRLVRAGLAATAVLTLGMALDWPGIWPALRFAAGVASAVVFLYTSGWCLEQLARRGVPSMGALIYTGPGAGIVVSGLVASALVAVQAPAAAGWLGFGLLAAALSALVWHVLDPASVTVRSGPAGAATTASPAAMVDGGDRAELVLLAVAYGLAGLGYIVTATFLPVIARQALPGSPWLDLFWPIFGAGVIIGALVASRLRGTTDLRIRLALCYLTQAAGVVASLVSPTLAGFALGSMLLGLPFTAITFFAMQEVRRLRPIHPTPLMGLVTAMYGLGQIAGPPLAALAVARSATAGAGFALSLWVASGTLVAGALLYVVLVKRYPAVPA